MSDGELHGKAKPIAAPAAELVWLGCVELPLRGSFRPLGFSLEIETNSQEVLAGAEQAWGRFRPAFGEPPLRLRIGVSAGGSAKCPPGPIFRAERKLLAMIADAGNFMICDLAQGFAFGWLTDAAVRNRAYLRYHFLEAPAFCLLESLYTTRLHGACVRSGNKGILLCGDAGAGKSSLAYACARSGWTLISDDASRLIRKRRDRAVVGNPHQMRLCASAMKLFPELQGLPAAPHISGKLAIELTTAGLPRIATAQECFIDYIVFLNRREPGPSALVPFPKASALRWFEQTPSLGDEEIRQAQIASLHTLLAAEVFEMRYRDLSWAVQRLKMLVQGQG